MLCIKSQARSHYLKTHSRSRIRKKQNMIESLSGMVFGQKMDQFTPAELHSEIFYAECNMLLSLLTFFQVGVALCYGWSLAE